MKKLDLKKEKKKQLWKRRLYSKPVIVLQIIVLVFLARGVFGMYQRASVAQQKYEESQFELTKIESEREQLTRRVESFDTGFGQEEAVRDRYDAVAPGERVVRIMRDDEDENTDNTDSDEGGFWAKIKTMFSNDEQ